jgi:hypothetical protein
LPILDGRNDFVEWLDHSKIDSAPFLSRFAIEGRHSLVLLNPGDWPCVFVVLYGRPFMLIRLTTGSSPGALAQNPAVVALFDYRNKTHEVVSAADGVVAFIRRFWSHSSHDGGSHGSGQEKKGRVS